MKGKLRSIAFIIIILLLLGIFAYCAYSLIVYYSASHQSKEVYNGLSEMLGPTRATIAIPSGDGTTHMILRLSDGQKGLKVFELKGVKVLDQAMVDAM